MKYSRLILTIVLLCGITALRANPISVMEPPPILPIEEEVHNLWWVHFFIYFYLYCITVFIEFTTAYFILKDKMLNLKGLLLGFIVIHLFTFPVTQYIAASIINIFPVHFKNSIYLAELFPLIAEFFLLRWLLKILLKRGEMETPVSNKTILATSLTMNLISFVIGTYIFLSFYS